MSVLRTLFAALVGISVFGQGAAGADPVPDLLQNLDASNANVAASAARSLGVIFAPGGRGGPQAEAVNQALIGKLGAPSKLVRAYTAKALGRIQAQVALPALKETVADADYGVAIEAAKAIRAILPVDDARLYLREIAADDSESVRVVAYEALAEIAKADDADFLVTAVDSPNWRIQVSAIRGLSRAINTGARPASEVYDKIADMLSSDIANVADAGVQFLTHTRNRETLRATIEAIDDQEGTSSWRKRTYALRAVYHMHWPRNEPALPAVVRQLGDPIANVQNEARGIINHLRTEKHINHRSLFPVLLTELEKAEGDSRRAGIMAEMQHRVPSEYAARLAKVAIKCLEESMDNKESWAVRAHAVQLIGWTENTSAIETIAKCAGDDVPNVRNATDHALSRLGPRCSESQKAAVAPILQTYLDDSRDWRKTAVAARNVGWYPSEAAIQPLVKLLSHGVSNVQGGASQSLAKMAQHHEGTLRDKVEAAVLPEMAATDLSWEYGAAVVGALQKDDHMPLLMKIMERGNWRAQQNATRAVMRIAQVSDVATPALNALLIANAQSTILQLQEVSNEALRVIAK